VHFYLPLFGVIEYNKHMPPEEFKKQVARVKEKEHTDAEKINDIVMLHKHIDEPVSKNINQYPADKKKILTVIAVIVLLVLGFVYAQKKGFWMNKQSNEQDKAVQQALRRMEEVRKENPPITEADVTAATNFMANLRSQEKASQTVQTKKK